MNPALPLLAGLCFVGAGIVHFFRRRGVGIPAGLATSWFIVGAAGLWLLAPALSLSDGVPSPSATLERNPPWKSSVRCGPADRGGNPELVDVTYQVEPWLLYMRGELRSGRLPYWNPHQGAGTPFWANGSSAPAFPLNLLFAALPLQFGLVLLPWLRIVIGGVGVWSLARHMGLRQEGALLAAVIYPLSGRLTAFLLFPMGNALCLVPWVFLAVEKLASRRRGGLVLLTVTGGLQLAAGHPETALMTGLATILYLVVRLPRFEFGVWLRYGAGWIVALALAAVAWLPLAFYLPRTSRWEFWEPSAPNSLVTIMGLWLRFLLPNAYGHSVDGTWWGPFGFVPTSVYAGAMTIPFAWAGAALWKRNRTVRALVVVLLVCLACSYHLPGFREVLLSIPMLQKTLHHYLLLAVELALALLAGFGFDRWLSGEGRRSLTVAAGLSLFALAAAWTLLVSRWSAHDQFVSQGAWTAAVAALVVLPGLTTLVSPMKRRRFVPGILLLAVLDLAAANARTNPGLSIACLYPRTPAIDFLVGREGRVAGVGDVFRPNAAMVYGLDDIRVDDSLKPLAYEQVYGRELATPDPTFFRPIVHWQNRWLDRLGVRWVIAPPGARPKTQEWRIARRGPDAIVFERPGALPLVRIADVGGGEGTSLSKAAAKVETRIPGRWRIDWTSPKPAVVEVAETWDPGWRALVDGRPAPIEQIDGLLLGVRVGPGSGFLDLRYRPRGLIGGIVVSFAGFLMVGALMTRRW